jgi:hypothetical protein
MGSGWGFEIEDLLKSSPHTHKAERSSAHGEAVLQERNTAAVNN